MQFLCNWPQARPIHVGPHPNLGGFWKYLNGCFGKNGDPNIDSKNAETLNLYPLQGSLVLKKPRWGFRDLSRPAGFAGGRAVRG